LLLDGRIVEMEMERVGESESERFELWWVLVLAIGIGIGRERETKRNLQVFKSLTVVEFVVAVLFNIPPTK
jgi:hypothetical protein